MYYFVKGIQILQVGQIYDTASDLSRKTSKSRDEESHEGENIIKNAHWNNFWIILSREFKFYRHVKFMMLHLRKVVKCRGQVIRGVMGVNIIKNAHWNNF